MTFAVQFLTRTFKTVQSDLDIKWFNHSSTNIRKRAITNSMKINKSSVRDLKSNRRHVISLVIDSFQHSTIHNQFTVLFNNDLCVSGWVGSVQFNDSYQVKSCFWILKWWSSGPLLTPSGCFGLYRSSLSAQTGSVGKESPCPVLVSWAAGDISCLLLNSCSTRMQYSKSGFSL